MQLFEKDPFLYWQIYVEGQDMVRTKYLELGKTFAEAMEYDHIECEDPMMEYLRVFLPRYPLREHDLNGIIEGVPILGKLDGFDEENLIVGEYKTGKSWNQRKVDTHGQLHFYALLVWLNYKRLPSKINLHWAKTEENENGDLRLTGDFTNYEAKVTMADVILMAARIKKAWEGIKELCVQEYQK